MIGEEETSFRKLYQEQKNGDEIRMDIDEWFEYYFYAPEIWSVIKAVMLMILKPLSNIQFAHKKEEVRTLPSTLLK